MKALDGENGRTVTADEMSKPTLMEWLQERRDNCNQIAKSKSGFDRAGWLDDARYFSDAIVELSARQQGEPVAWRWRARNLSTTKWGRWYLEDHAMAESDYLLVEPLYTAPPAPPADPWSSIESALKDRMILGAVDGQTRFVKWGKTSHVPIYGWCLADQGAEDFDICHPTHWMPLPVPPAPPRSEKS